MLEKWEKVPGYPNYRVSNLGRVLGAKGRILKHAKVLGYHRVVLYSGKAAKPYFVHRLVMLAFVGPSTLDVDHKDSDKNNNTLANLQYVTQLENSSKARRDGRYKPNFGNKNGMSKLKETDVHEIKLILRGTSLSNALIGRMYKVSAATISNIKTGKAWRHVA